MPAASGRSASRSRCWSWSRRVARRRYQTAREEPVFPSDADWPQRAFCRIVDGHSPVFGEQAERGAPTQAIAEGFRQITLARDQSKWRKRPVASLPHIGRSWQIAEFEKSRLVPMALDMPDRRSTKRSIQSFIPACGTAFGAIILYTSQHLRKTHPKFIKALL